MAEAQAKIQQGAFAPKQPAAAPAGPSHQVDTQVDMLLAQSKLMDSETKRGELQIKHHDNEDENKNRQLDRQSREKVQVLQLARDILLHPANAGEAEKVASTVSRDVGRS